MFHFLAHLKRSLPFSADNHGLGLLKGSLARYKSVIEPTNLLSMENLCRNLSDSTMPERRHKEQQEQDSGTVERNSVVIWEWPRVCVYHSETFCSHHRPALKEEHLWKLTLVTTPVMNIVRCHKHIRSCDG
jgi:hypothetical protein